MLVHVLSAADVAKALPMADAIAGMKVAFAQLSTGKAVMPLRSHTAVVERGNTLAMSAHLQETDDLAIKVVSIFPNNNVEQGKPTIYAAVLVLDAKSGQLLALLEGSRLTAIRTGAGSGAATDLLARSDAKVVAIIGSGVQARTQLEAVCTVRAIESVRIYSPTREHAAIFAQEMAGQGVIPSDVRVMKSAETAVRGADIVCTATTATTPVFDGAWLAPGTHVNGVGSFRPTMQEVDETTVQRAMIVVDSVAAALAEAGDLLVPLQNGRIREADINRELGHIITGQKEGRANQEQITFFKSVGVAVQDAIAGRIVLENAKRLQLGTTIPFQ